MQSKSNLDVSLHDDEETSNDWRSNLLSTIRSKQLSFLELYSLPTGSDSAPSPHSGLVAPDIHHDRFVDHAHAHNDAGCRECQLRIDYTATHIARIHRHMAHKRKFYERTRSNQDVSRAPTMHQKYVVYEQMVPVLQKLYTPKIEAVHYRIHQELLQRGIIDSPPQAENNRSLSIVLKHDNAIGWDLINRVEFQCGLWTDVGTQKKVNEDECSFVHLYRHIYDMINFGYCTTLPISLSLPDGIETFACPENLRVTRENNIHEEHLQLFRQLLMQAPTLPMYYAAIFDGHNGSVASKFMNQNFLRVLLQKPDFWTFNFTAAFRSTFNELESLQVPRAGLVEENEWEIADGGSLTPGTTAVVALIIGPKVVIADLGDSRAILSRAAEMYDLTFDHRPSDPVEKWRLKHEGKGSVDTGGGYLNGYLAVSRAVGDHHRLSRSKLNGLVCEPDFLEFCLHEEDEFLLLACDGIFDVMSSKQAGDYVRRYLRSKIPHSLTDFDGAAQALIDQVKARGGNDNLTVAVIGLQFMKT